GNRRFAATIEAGRRPRAATRPARGARRLLLQLLRGPACRQPQRLGRRPPRLRPGIPVRIRSLTTSAVALLAAVTGVVTLLPPAPARAVPTAAPGKKDATTVASSSGAAASGLSKIVVPPGGGGGDAAAVPTRNGDELPLPSEGDRDRPRI